MSATAADPIHRIVDAFDARPVGNHFVAHCPGSAHGNGDRRPSLTITPAGNGAVLMFCQVCGKGATPAILAAKGLKMTDLFQPRSSNGRHNGTGAARKIVATYDYLNYCGDLLYQVVRYSPKNFRQRRPDGHGGWIWNLDGVDRVLYGLIELRESDPDAWVFIIEGEKDCDRLGAAGLTAVCNVGGAGKWRPEYNEYLRDRLVAIVPDDDGPGRRHAQAVAASLRGISREIRIVELPPGGQS